MNAIPIKLKLSKRFQTELNTHPKLSHFKPTTEGNPYNLIPNGTDFYEFYFFGRGYNQFKIEGEALNFIAAYNELLRHHQIGLKHHDDLLYLMSYFDIDYERQSIQNNTQNRLNEYADFISDLTINSRSSYDVYTNRDDYHHIHDEHSGDVKFIRKDFPDKDDDLETLMDAVAPSDDPTAVIHFKIYKIYDRLLPIGNDLSVAVIGSRGLHNVKGKRIKNIPIPAYLQDDIFQELIEKMCETLKLHDHPFYQLFTDNTTSLEDIAAIYETKRLTKITHRKTIFFVADLIATYLIKHNQYRNEVWFSRFLFNLLSLFKVFGTTEDNEVPANYHLVSTYYEEHDIMNAEKLRLQLVEESRPKR